MMPRTESTRLEESDFWNNITQKGSRDKPLEPFFYISMPELFPFLFTLLLADGTLALGLLLHGSLHLDTSQLWID